MKSMKKILALVLALTLVLSVQVFAALPSDPPCKVHVKYVATKTDKVVAGTGETIYRIDMFVNSTHSLVAFHVRCAWEDSTFFPVNATNLKKLPGVNKNMFLNQPDCIFNPEFTGYAPYADDGYYAESDVHADTGYAYFASDTPTTCTKMSPADLGITGYSGGIINYQTAYTDNFLLVSGGQGGGTMQSPTRGNVNVGSCYIALKADAPNGVHTVGVQDGQVGRFDGAYVNTDAPDSLGVGDQMVTIVSQDIKDVTFENAVIDTTAPAEKEIEKLKSQVRFDREGDGVADHFDYRLITSISKPLMTELKANQASLEVGFIAAYNDGITADEVNAAHAAIEAGSEPSAENPRWFHATGTFIFEAADGHGEFGSRINGISGACVCPNHVSDPKKDIVVDAYVKYTDAEGTHIYWLKGSYFIAEISTGYDNAVKSFNELYAA